ncbi:Cullin-2 [Halotydeus destructor]|nr:Cullin-2 [Halotydeus destructor]
MSLKPEHVDFDSTWARLSRTVEGVSKLENVDRREWNDRFSDVYKLCVAYPDPLGDRLYTETKQFLDSHVKSLYREVVNNASDGGNLLQAYYNYWHIYRKGVDYLNKLYMYLNTQHIKKQKCSEADLSYGCIEMADQKLEIGELGLHLWRKNMVEPLQERLIRLLLEAIQSDRTGRASNDTVVQGVILSLVEVEEYKKKGALDLYQQMFEKPFLDASGEFYKRQAEELLEVSDCSQYMERVLTKLDAENLRSRKYLHPSSYPRITVECESRMIASHLPFLHGECKLMVDSDKRKDMQNMYKLLKPIESGLSVLVQEVQQHVTRLGLTAVSNLAGENVPQMFVENVLSVHKKNLAMIKEVFNGDQLFVGALDKACAAVINHRRNSKLPCRSPELLARYCDSLLKKTARGFSESEIDDKLAQSITVFKYIDDKDVFQKFYAKMLAKRLIHSQSISMDSEESMINKLKQACGYEFTSKLHRMFTDIKLSDDLNHQFSSWCKENHHELGIHFSIFVLQAGAWPLQQTAISPFAIPQYLEKSVSNFESYYNSKFSGRKLTWLHHLSTTEVRMSFTKKLYSVSMGTYHMAIMFLFENSDALTYAELVENTKLTDEQLVKHLQSLVDAKLLIAHHGQLSSDSLPTSPTATSSQNSEASNSSEASNLKPSSPQLCQLSPVPADLLLTLNLNFSNKRTKFKITAVVQKEVQQQQETEQTHASVDEDRKLYLQASIVRIMKARKVIKHNCLVQEVIEQSKLRFTPNVAMIKKCIEALMEKQYLERTSDSTDEYQYIA